MTSPLLTFKLRGSSKDAREKNPALRWRFHERTSMFLVNFDSRLPYILRIKQGSIGLSGSNYINDNNPCFIALALTDLRCSHRVCPHLQLGLASHVLRIKSFQFLLLLATRVPSEDFSFCQTSISTTHVGHKCHGWVPQQGLNIAQASGFHR